MALTRCLAVLLCMSSVALDAMAFRDEAHGTAFSDSVDGRFAIFTTRNGGTEWIGTTASRVLRSLDGGRTWSVAATKLATGEATGIFSMAFRDASHGIVVGGNYQQESGAVDNVATTSDGGATWCVSEASRDSDWWWRGCRAAALEGWPWGRPGPTSPPTMDARGRRPAARGV